MVGIVSVQLRDFRTYVRAEAHLGQGLTVVHGPNGVGKSNLLEAIYFGCTARSPRTHNERELVRFGAEAARVVVRTTDGDEPHELSVGFGALAGDGRSTKRMTSDGAPVERLLDVPDRPLLSVFMPDRLELLKGAPTLRRAHLDQFVAAIWPARADVRREYSRVLAQRNALLGGIRSGRASQATLATWDRELAGKALALRSLRSDAVALLTAPFAERAAQLGCSGDPALSCRSDWRAISSGVSPATARTGTSWPSCATAASCVSTAPRASSASPCSPCSLPSERSWPASAATRRSCSSTT
jgi:DNA replication and repair protein RecF